MLQKQSNPLRARLVCMCTRVGCGYWVPTVALTWIHMPLAFPPARIQAETLPNYDINGHGHPISPDPGLTGLPACMERRTPTTLLALDGLYTGLWRCNSAKRRHSRPSPQERPGRSMVGRSNTRSSSGLPGLGGAETLISSSSALSANRCSWRGESELTLASSKPILPSR